jgi:hypothetical protein
MFARPLLIFTIPFLVFFLAVSLCGGYFIVENKIDYGKVNFGEVWSQSLSRFWTVIGAGIIIFCLMLCFYFAAGSLLVFFSRFANSKLTLLFPIVFYMAWLFVYPYFCFYFPLIILRGFGPFDAVPNCLALVKGRYFKVVLHLLIRAIVPVAIGLGLFALFGDYIKQIKTAGDINLLSLGFIGFAFAFVGIGTFVFNLNYLIILMKMLEGILPGSHAQDIDINEEPMADIQVQTPAISPVPQAQQPSSKMPSI